MAEEQQPTNAIISSLCWVNRGYAKAMLEEYEPTEQELKKHKKLTKKLLKGKNITDISKIFRRQIY